MSQPSLSPRRGGFTLIELLLVVIVIGVIAALVLPKFSGVKASAYEDAMLNDLRNVVTHQEIHHDNTGSYAPDPAGLSDFTFSRDVYRVESSGDGSAWDLTVAHNKTDVTCAIAGGVGSADGSERIRCTSDGLTVAVNDATPESGQTLTFDASQSIAEMAMGEIGLPGASLLAADPSEIATIAWDFGDETVQSGGPGTHTVVTHSYDVAGSYVVVLTITKNDGSSQRGSRVIDVVEGNQAPVASFTTLPSVATAGEEVSFDAGSSDDADGDPLTYAWDFGGLGSGTGASTSFVFSSAGDYTVRLEVTDPLGLSGAYSETVQVVTPINPSFSLEPAQVESGSLVTLTGAADVSVSEWRWSFGDGSAMGSGQSVQHSWSEGTYSVSLTTIAQDGRSSTVSETLTVTAAPEVLVDSNDWRQWANDISWNGNFRWDRSLSYAKTYNMFTLPCYDWSGTAVWAEVTAGENQTQEFQASGEVCGQTYRLTLVGDNFNMWGTSTLYIGFRVQNGNEIWLYAGPSRDVTGNEAASESGFRGTGTLLTYKLERF